MELLYNDLIKQRVQMINIFTNGNLKEKKQILILEENLLLLFFELNTEKKVRMEMVYSIFLKLVKLMLNKITQLLITGQQILNIKVQNQKNIFQQNQAGQMILKMYLPHILIVGYLLENIKAENEEDIQILLSGLNMAKMALVETVQMDIELNLFIIEQQVRQMPIQ